MDQKLKSFFDAAQEKAREVSFATAAANRQLRSDRAQNRATLEGDVKAEFGPLVNLLEKLPQKNGRRFRGVFAAGDSNYTPQKENSTGAGIYSFKLGYLFDDEVAGGADWRKIAPKPYAQVEVLLKRENGTTQITVTQSSMVEGTPPRFVEQKAASFEEARQLIGQGVGNFAPERVAEIGKALAAREIIGDIAAFAPAPVLKPKAPVLPLWTIIYPGAKRRSR